MTAVEEQSATCSKCGLSTNTPQLLKAAQRSFRLGYNRKQLLCPRCIAHENSLVHYVTYAFYVVLAINFIVLSYLSPSTPHQDNSKYFVLFCDGFAFCLPIMVVVHELAHAIVGWATGLKVGGIQIGIGPRVFRLRLGKRFFVDIRLCPVSGLCFVYPVRSSEKRWPIALTIAAGPAVHLITIVAIGFYITSGFTTTSRLSDWDWWSVVFWVNAMMLLGGLTPRDVQIDGWSGPNDMKQLLHLPRSRAAAREWNRTRCLYGVELLLECGDVSGARSWFDNLRAGAPDNLHFQLYELSVLGAEGKWKEIYEKTDAWRSAPSTPQNRQAYAAWLAVACVYTEGDLAQTQLLANESVSITPWDPAGQTVQSLVALAEGNYQRAEELLKRTRGARVGYSAAAAAAHVWAEIYRHKKDPKRQRKWRDRAKKLDPNDGFVIPQSWLAVESI